MFHDRVDAGRKLARVLHNLEGIPAEIPAPADAPRSREQIVVLAIPRGGVVVGAEVARMLGAPLDIWLAHKLGAPGNPEFAIGSVSVNGERYLDQATIDFLGISEAYLEEEIELQGAELARRMKRFRGHAEPLLVRGKTVILVDDGIATGATVFAAVASLRRAGVGRLILAVPVAPHETVPKLEAVADDVVVLSAPFGFASVGQFYERFEQVSEEEVVRLLGS